MVTHGDFMGVVLNDLERLWVDEWREREIDKAYDLDNCAIIRFARSDPTDPSQVHPNIRWYQIINPHNPDDSFNNGEWVEIKSRQARTAKELLHSVQNVERLLDANGDARG